MVQAPCNTDKSTFQITGVRVKIPERALVAHNTYFKCAALAPTSHVSLISIWKASTCIQRLWLVDDCGARAFSQLVADPQFSSTGLILLAQLAVLKDIFSRHEAAEPSDSAPLIERNLAVGVLVARSHGLHLSSPNADEQGPRLTKEVMSERLGKLYPTGLERKKHNVIDDIFKTVA